jgi:predicted nucleotidyltransferase
VVALKIMADEAKTLINELLEQKYIEPTIIIDGRPYWHNTIKGNSLANASAAKPVGRQKANKAFAEFMGRVNQVNQDPYFLYEVVQVALFGSYITDANTVNDVDVAVDLTPKEDALNLRSHMNDQRRQEACEKGIRFKNTTEYVCWPEIEVWKFLKGHSHVISIHHFNDALAVTSVLKIVFTEGKPDN